MTTTNYDASIDYDSAIDYDGVVLNSQTQSGVSRLARHQQILATLSGAYMNDFAKAEEEEEEMMLKNILELYTTKYFN